MVKGVYGYITAFLTYLGGHLRNIVEIQIFRICPLEIKHNLWIVQVSRAFL